MTQADFLMMRGLQGREQDNDLGGNLVLSGGISIGTGAGGSILLKIPTQAANGTDATTLGPTDH